MIFLNLSLVFTGIPDFVDRGWGQLDGYFPPTRETKTRNCANAKKNEFKNKQIHEVMIRNLKLFRYEH